MRPRPRSRTEHRRCRYLTAPSSPARRQDPPAPIPRPGRRQASVATQRRSRTGPRCPWARWPAAPGAATGAHRRLADVVHDEAVSATQQLPCHRLAHVADPEITHLHRRSPNRSLSLAEAATVHGGLHGRPLPSRLSAPYSAIHRRKPACAREEDASMGPKLVDYLLYEPEESGILWIKFNRPERMNALVGTAEENGTVAKVGEYMRAGDDDPNIRVIVLTGVGRGFCSGANLGSRAVQDVTGENLPGNRGPHEGPDAARQHFFHGFTQLHRDISLIRKPTIAMINGAAVGSGMDMALHCDIRIGCEKTRFIGYHNAGQIDR